MNLRKREYKLSKKNVEISLSNAGTFGASQGGRSVAHSPIVTLACAKENVDDSLF